MARLHTTHVRLNGEGRGKDMLGMQGKEGKGGRSGHSDRPNWRREKNKEELWHEHSM